MHFPQRSFLLLFTLIGCAQSDLSALDSAGLDSGDPLGVNDDPPLVDPSESTTGLAQLDGLGVRNVIVIHADTMRADRLPFYGHDRQTTPNLFHEPFLVVRGYRAAGPWTLPSTTSALTALTPEHHGNVAIAGGTGVSGVAETVAEHFRDAGYATGAFSGNRVVSADPDLARGFDTVLDIDDVDNVEAQAMASLWENGEAWLDGIEPGVPFYLWLQPMDTHPPYRPAKPYRGTFADYDEVPFDIAGNSFEQEEAFIGAFEAATSEAERQTVIDATLDVYDELVLQQDATIEAVFAWLEETGHQDDTLVVFTADHGETVADDGAPTLSHMKSVRPELVNLPLAFFHPSLDSGWSPCVASNVDLGPTLIRAVGVDTLEGVDGKPIQDGCRELVFSSLYSSDGVEDTVTWLSVMDDAYKLDWDCGNKIASIYDLARDPSTNAPLDPASVPGGERYWAALETYLADAMMHNPSLTCPMPVPTFSL